MQPEDSSCSSSFSSEDLDMEQQEAMLVEKYGALKLKQRMFTKKQQGGRRYFDSADWSLQKQGKHSNDTILDFGPIDWTQMPVKSEPSVPNQRSRSHLDAMTWAEPLPVQQSRNVIDI